MRTVTRTLTTITALTLASAVTTTISANPAASSYNGYPYPTAKVVTMAAKPWQCSLPTWAWGYNTCRTWKNYSTAYKQAINPTTANAPVAALLAATGEPGYATDAGRQAATYTPCGRIYRLQSAGLLTDLHNKGVLDATIAKFFRSGRWTGALYWPTARDLAARASTLSQRELLRSKAIQIYAASTNCNHGY